MKTLFLGVLIFVSQQAAAGISSIGNGGGLGELQFIYYFNNTDQIIEICEKSPACHINPEQKTSWNQLKLVLGQIKDNVNIAFEPSVVGSWSWVNGTLAISQQWLYQDHLDALRSDSEIMIFALAIQLSHTQHLDFNKTFQQTAKALSGLSFYNQSSISRTNAFRFHWITLSSSENGSENLKLFVLEDLINSYPLNSWIQLKSKDINLNSIEVYNISVINSDSEITVYGSMSGYKGPTYFNQRPFKFTATINNKNLIDKDSIQLFLSLE